MENRTRFSNSWKYINSIDWRQTKFSLEKAYICSLFAESAYWHIPEYELSSKSRINVIPCSQYRKIVSTGKSINIGESLSNADFGDFFIIEREYAIIVGVRIGKFTIVAIRGTQKLYDWLINLNASKFKIPFGGYEIAFHRGFFRAIYTSFSELREKLKKEIELNIPIYVTGHSLGGALAAIFHSLPEYSLIFSDPKLVPTNSCYTFGMPRYGNLEAIAFLKNPFHIQNEKDIVPYLPPLWFGYETTYNRFRIDGSKILQRSESHKFKFLNYILHLIFRIRQNSCHDIESYKESIHSHLDSDS